MKASSDFQAAKLARLAALGLAETEFEEKFARSSGPGGQNVNKVSTAVTLRHVPTGISVVSQDSRSQAMNRQTAWLRLLGAIEKKRAEEKAERVSAREKKRRQNGKRPWGLKMRILDGKKRRGAVKKLRAKDW